MNDEQRTQLDEQGYLIFKSLLAREQVEAPLARLEGLWAMEGEKAGEENYIEAVMGAEIRASMVNARDVPPHTGVRMPFQMDSDKGRHHDEKGYSAAPAIWMLDPFKLLGLDDEPNG